MTTLQLKVAIAIKELGSISAAAEKLEISQPNVSSYLKSLEKEIGFSIFNRKKSGTTLTEEGSIFLDHAKNIIEEHDSILNIKKHQNQYRLRVGTTNYSASIEPFIKICNQHINDEEAEFCYVNLSIMDAINKLDNYDLDIVTVPTLKSQLASLKGLCKKNELSMIPICELPTVLNVRKDHPAILDGRCEHIVQGSDLMKDYPYVTYRNLFENSGPSIGYNDSDFIQCSYKIQVDGNDTRLRVISNTNAFSFGILLPEKVRDFYNIKSFIVPNIIVEIFCLIRESDKNKKEILDYIKLFKEEYTLNN